jgi:hypothetical protein
MVNASDETTLANLSRAFVSMGASPEQARVMAAQMLKRARQLAHEKQISEVEAMSDLLTKVVQGRQGTYTGTTPTAPPPAQ